MNKLHKLIGLVFLSFCCLGSYSQASDAASQIILKRYIYILETERIIRKQADIDVMNSNNQKKEQKLRDKVIEAAKSRIPTFLDSLALTKYNCIRNVSISRIGSLAIQKPEVCELAGQSGSNPALFIEEGGKQLMLTSTNHSYYSFHFNSTQALKYAFKIGGDADLKKMLEGKISSHLTRDEVEELNLSFIAGHFENRIIKLFKKINLLSPLQDDIDPLFEIWHGYQSGQLTGASRVLESFDGVFIQETKGITHYLDNVINASLSGSVSLPFINISGSAETKYKKSSDVKIDWGSYDIFFDKFASPKFAFIPSANQVRNCWNSISDLYSKRVDVKPLLLTGEGLEIDFEIGPFPSDFNIANIAIDKEFSQLYLPTRRFIKSIEIDKQKSTFDPLTHKANLRVLLKRNDNIIKNIEANVRELKDSIPFRFYYKNDIQLEGSNKIRLEKEFPAIEIKTECRPYLKIFAESNLIDYKDTSKGKINYSLTLNVDGIDNGQAVNNFSIVDILNLSPSLNNIRTYLLKPKIASSNGNIIVTISLPKEELSSFEEESFTFQSKCSFSLGTHENITRTIQVHLNVPSFVKNEIMFTDANEMLDKLNAVFVSKDTVLLALYNVYSMAKEDKPTKDRLLSHLMTSYGVRRTQNGFIVRREYLSVL